MSFELLGDQVKVRNMINFKIHSVHKMQPICNLEALNNFKGENSALEGGWSSLRRGTGLSIQAPGPLCLLASWLNFSVLIGVLVLCS